VTVSNCKHFYLVLHRKTTTVAWLADIRQECGYFSVIYGSTSAVWKFMIGRSTR